MAVFNNVRLCLKYDTFANWSNEAKNPILLAGEVAIVVPGDKLADVDPVSGSESVVASPCLMKIGDGVHHFNDLPWLSAAAADVHRWAKKSEDEFKAWLLGTAMVPNPDYDPSQPAEGDNVERKPDPSSPKLATKEEVNAVSSALTDLTGRVDTVEQTLGEVQANVNVDHEALGTLQTQVGENAVAIGELQAAVGTSGENSLGSRVTALESRTDSVDNQLTAITGDENTDGSIAKAVKVEQTRAENAEKGLSDKLDTLIGSDADKSVRNIAADEINILIKGSDPEGGKTIENIANLVSYVDQNAGEIAELITQVDTNTSGISANKQTLDTKAILGEINAENDHLSLTLNGQPLSIIFNCGNANMI